MSGQNGMTLLDRCSIVLTSAFGVASNGLPATAGERFVSWTVFLAAEHWRVLGGIAIQFLETAAKVTAVGPTIGN